MERFHRVDGVQQIGGAYFIPESAAGSAIQPETVVPVYFGVVQKTELRHDSPAIGCVEDGATHRKIIGPFTEKQDLNRQLKREQEQIDHISYRFGANTVVRLLRPEQVPESGNIHVFRYFDSCFYISSGHRYSVYTPRPTEVVRFSELMSEGLRKSAKEKRETPGSLLGILEKNCVDHLVQLSLIGGNWPEFFMKVFSNSQNPFFVYDFLEGYESFASSMLASAVNLPTIECVSLEPVRLSLSHDSIQRFIDSHPDMIR